MVKRCAANLLLASAAFARAPTAEPAEPAPHHEGHSHQKSAVAGKAVADAQADSLSARAQAQFDTGQFAAAADTWADARARYAKSGQADRYCDTSASLAAALTAVGQRVRAAEVATEGIAVAKEHGDPAREGSLLVARARAAMFGRDADSAEEDLLSAEIIAGRTENDALLLQSNIEQGNLHAAAGQTVRALSAYETAQAVAEHRGDRMSLAIIAVNASLAAAEGAHSTDVEWVERAQRAVEKLDNSYSKAHALLTLANARRIISVSRNEAEQIRPCYEDILAARTIAEQIPNLSLQSYAWGQLGELYALQKQADDAIVATRKALFFAQQSQSTDAAFKFQWQLARLLRDTGRTDDAIEAYNRSLASLRGIRHDLAIGYGNRNSRTSFRKSVGPVFYESADLMLKRSDALPDDASRQASLKLARDTIEELKSAELDDYFQDDCVNLVKAKARNIDIGLVNTAVVYVIPLADRTEILLSTPSGLQRFKVDVTDAVLTAEVRELRVLLEDELDYSYRQHAAKVYDWLIRPLESALAGEKIDTLVFVPDGELRTVPMAALYDKQAKQHLVEKFAVAVSPGLELTDPRPLTARGKVGMLSAGVSEARQNFPALPSVPAELDELSTLYDGVQLKDAAFQQASFSDQFKGDSYTIVHIASHGKFAGDARDTFVLTYDGRLNLNDLEKLIQPSQFRGQPVELLTLSACQTAAGDDGARAALGLAGVAIKAGARSAFASLWSVNDAASTQLIGDFYTRLRSDPTATKARALQAAQIDLLKQPRYRHPRYWAPYLIIGNWM